MRTAWATHSLLMTGSMPGIAASTSDTCVLGAPPNSVEAPENSLAREVTCAWTSRPITTSQSPVAPLMSFEFVSPVIVFVPLRQWRSTRRSLPPRLRQTRAPRRLLDRLAEREQRLLVEGPADQLQAERQAFRR